MSPLSTMNAVLPISLIIIAIISAINFTVYEFLPARNSLINLRLKRSLRERNAATEPKATGNSEQRKNHQIKINVTLPARKSAIYGQRPKLTHKINRPESSLKPEPQPGQTKATANDRFRCSNEEKLFNPRAYNWTIINPEFCFKKYPDLLLLIVAITSLNQRSHRQYIRKTWGDTNLYKRYKTAVIFPVGRNNDSLMMNEINEEQQKYGDMLQQDFMDTNQNVTHKSFMWLQFINDFCPNVKYLLKIDSDMTFDYFKMVDILRKWSRFHYSRYGHASKTFACSCADNELIQRELSKWNISKKEYSMDRYSTYCKGSFYLLTSDLVQPLLKQAHYCTYFSLENVHITGHLGSLANASCTNWSKRVTYGLTDPSSIAFNTNILFASIDAAWKHDVLWKILKKRYYADDSRFIK